jgi:hypothetical protein
MILLGWKHRWVRCVWCAADTVRAAASGRACGWCGGELVPVDRDEVGRAAAARRAAAVLPRGTALT